MHHIIFTALVDCSTTSAAPVPPPPSSSSSSSASATAAGVANSTQPVTTAKDAKDVVGRRDTEDADDTMRNLRKTFAGIFGDM